MLCLETKWWSTIILDRCVARFSLRAHTRGTVELRGFLPDATYCQALRDEVTGDFCSWFRQIARTNIFCADHGQLCSSLRWPISTSRKGNTWHICARDAYNYKVGDKASFHIPPSNAEVKQAGRKPKHLLWYRGPAVIASADVRS